MTEGVLVVDDSRTIRLVTVDFLKEVGFTEVAEAGDAEEALRMFRKSRPRLIFLDLQIPKGDGKEVARQILEDNPYAKIVVVSAEAADSEIGKQLLRLGVYEYLQKPVKREDLFRVTKRMRSESGPQWTMTREGLASGGALLEYSPGKASDQFPRFFKDLVSQFDKVHLFTSRGSPLDEAIGNDTNIKLHILSSSGSFDGKQNTNVEIISIRDPSRVADAIASIVEGRSQERTLIIFDSITDMILQIGFDTSYSLIRQLLNLIAAHEITALFILNVEAHENRQVAAIRGLMSNRINLSEGAG